MMAVQPGALVNVKRHLSIASDCHVKLPDKLRIVLANLFSGNL